MGARPEYAAAATATGEMLAREGFRLVFGAGDVGLMGAAAQAARAAGGRTLGVIPRHLVGRGTGKEAAGADPARHVITETMHERKKVMFMNSDAIVMLPGGAGSLDEFFEVLTWRQLGLHDKPVYLLDVAGYWAPLLALLDHVIAEGFADASLKGFVSRADNVQDLATSLRAALS